MSNRDLIVQRLIGFMKLQMFNITTTVMMLYIWVISSIVIITGLNGDWSLVALILLGLYVYSSIMLWKTVFVKRIAPLELMFWLFHTNFLLLPALSQSISRNFYWSSYRSYQQESLLYACFIIVVGLIAFKIGANLGHFRSKKLNRRVGGLKFIERYLEQRVVVYVFLILLLIGLLAIVSIMDAEFFMSSRITDFTKIDSLAELGLFLSLPRAVAIAVLLFSVALFVQQLRSGRGIPFITTLIIIAAFGVNAIVNYPLSIARFWFFGTLISLIWIVWPLRLTAFRSLFVVGMSAMQFTLLPWYSLITRGTGQVVLNAEAVQQYLNHGDFDGFQSIVNITIYIQEVGFHLGKNILSVLLFFVPRSVWDKSEALGVATAKHMGYEFTNLSAPIYGEFYADFGLISLVLGMGIVGFTISLFDNYYDRAIRSNRYGAAVLFTSVLAGFLIILLRGSLLSVISSIAALFGILVILVWLSIRDRYRFNLSLK